MKKFFLLVVFAICSLYTVAQVKIYTVEGEIQSLTEWQADGKKAVAGLYISDGEYNFLMGRVLHQATAGDYSRVSNLPCFSSSATPDNFMKYMQGKENSQKIASVLGYPPALDGCKQCFSNEFQGYIPSIGQLYIILKHEQEIEELAKEVSSDYHISTALSNYVTSNKSNDPTRPVVLLKKKPDGSFEVSNELPYSYFVDVIPICDLKKEPVIIANDVDPKFSDLPDVKKIAEILIANKETEILDYLPKIGFTKRGYVRTASHEASRYGYYVFTKNCSVDEYGDVNHFDSGNSCYIQFGHYHTTAHDYTDDPCRVIITYYNIDAMVYSLNRLKAMGYKQTEAGEDGGTFKMGKSEFFTSTNGSTYTITFRYVNNGYQFIW